MNTTLLMKNSYAIDLGEHNKDITPVRDPAKES
jgi:hypothetical protein